MNFATELYNKALECRQGLLDRLSAELVTSALYDSNCFVIHRAVNNVRLHIHKELVLYIEVGEVYGTV